MRVLGCCKPRPGSCLLSDVNMGVGDAAMGMVISHLIFASTSCADCETLHDRRKVMVTLCAAKPLWTGKTNAATLAHKQTRLLQQRHEPAVCIGNDSTSGSAGDARILC